MIRKLLALSLTTTLILSGCGQGTVSTPPGNGNANTTPPPAPPTPTTASAAIKHVVVIFGENISFDHYFGTYPNAANTGGTPFTAAAGTPTNINNYISNPTLLTANPNLNNANGVITGGVVISTPSNPFRLGPAQAATADQDHNYGPEQMAFDNGQMDLFPFSVGAPDSSYNTATVNLAAATNAPAVANTNALTMGYYDGNTVSAMWNYAQHYALNDHSFGSTFGASTQGALNLVSGQTNGANVILSGAASGVVADGQGGFTLIGDEDPAYDVCSSTTATVQMTGKNIGDLLNQQGVSWGNFAGGFNLSITNTSTNGVIASGSGCLPNEVTPGSRATGAVNIPGNPLKADYIPHHEPFQYYASTANPTHIRPASAAVIGTAADTGSGKANHQYDVLDFSTVLAGGNLPAVSILKAPGYQDAHAGYSDPLDEQTFVVNTINAIQNSSYWSSTAIIIAYDDSDGWYDHLTDFVNGSQTTADAAGFCNSAPVLAGVTSTAPVQGRCGHGPRLPLLVISPWAKKNYVDNTPTDQASITQFIEDVFLNGTRIGGGSYDASAGTLMNMFDFNSTTPPNPNVVLLSPSTGAVTTGN